MAQQKKQAGALSGIAAGSGGLFGIVIVGLFLMMVSSTCAEMGAEYVQESTDTVELLVTVPLSLVAAIVGAAITASVFAGAAMIVTEGFRWLVSGYAATQKPGRLIGTGFLLMALAGGLGGWRMVAGYDSGEPAWVMQGTVVMAVGVIFGILLVAPYVGLALRRGEFPPPPPADEDDDSWPPEMPFAFCAVVGLVLSYGVVEYVHIGRAQAGSGPMPMGEFVDGWVRKESSLGYPDEMMLDLPRGLDGSMAIVFIEVNPCTMKVLDEDDEPVRVKRIRSKKDDDGDTETYARLVFEARSKERYRLKLTASGNDCMYSVRLVEHEP